ncbi:putative ABC transporter permease [Desulfosporosinus meridiei]|uniref:Putative membrane protein n=1 Tax=Desulfosporosinus meridiei (strain ATCC BAA-275 / DSM 13257 / KCTC 12902 / NCIMB 13706 / S10) TaxID=768704 RepID=J7ITD8_DESMD|nr:putative ABC transporter permease [Desulfosporosinus meridiei]AFQ43429.1 putative membrane protein [Desulfosporosinus meridiei DSM 13257]
MLTDFILTFSIYAFAGWVMETLYRSSNQRRLVNPGFLSGPFLPIYGFFSTLVIWTSELISGVSLPLQFLWFVFLSTLLEYVAGWFFERFYHLQLWDYHSIPFNLQGRIALPFSLIWGGLGLVFYHIINPTVQLQIQLTPFPVRTAFALIMSVYVIWDLIHSSLLLRRLEHFVTAFQERYERLELPTFHIACSPFYRLLHTYPKMRHTLHEKMALLYAKQEAMEHFLKLQRNKFYNPDSENNTHSLD